MDVEIKDRATEIEYLRMALNMCELFVDYRQSDLIATVMQELEAHKGKLTLKDLSRIFHNWKTKWENYCNEKAKQKTE